MGAASKMKKKLYKANQDLIKKKLVIQSFGNVSLRFENHILIMGVNSHIINSNSKKYFNSLSVFSNQVELLNTCTDCKDKHDKVVRLFKKYNSKPDSNYKCPCCKLTSQQIKDKHGGFHSHQSKDVWCVDVCHVTMTVRGYICDYCNNTIGRSADSIYVLFNCALYILKFKLKRLFHV